MSDSEKKPHKEQTSSADETKQKKKRAPPGEFDRQVEAVRREMQAIKESLEETERKLQEAERLRSLYGPEFKREDTHDADSAQHSSKQQSTSSSGGRE